MDRLAAELLPHLPPALPCGPHHSDACSLAQPCSAVPALRDASLCPSSRTSRRHRLALICALTRPANTPTH